MPGSIPNDPSRLLIDVLTQLKKFVVNTASRLLQSTQLLSSEKSILECHIDGCKQTMKFKASKDHREANVTAIMKNRRPIVKTATKENAEEDACVKMTTSLPQVGTFPNSPCISQHLSPLPHEAKEAAANKLIKEGTQPVLIEVEHFPIPIQRVGKTYRMVLNEFKQKVDNLNMMATIKWSGPHEVEQSYFETELFLIITRRGNNDTVFQISSDKHKRMGKNDSKEAAAQHVLEKCEKKGIIILSPK